MYFSTTDAHDINTACNKNRRPRWRGGLRLYRENLENMKEEKTTAGVKKKLKWEEDGKVLLRGRKCHFPPAAVSSLSLIKLHLHQI